MHKTARPLICTDQIISSFRSTQLQVKQHSDIYCNYEFRLRRTSDVMGLRHVTSLYTVWFIGSNSTALLLVNLCSIVQGRVALH